MRLKCIVTGLLFLEALHIILVTHSVFVYTISGHGNFNRLGDVVWSVLIQVLPGTLVVALVQSVWIIRIRTLNLSHRGTLVTVVMLSLVFIEAGMSIAWMVAIFFFPRWGAAKGVMRIIVASFCLRAFNDTFATGLLCYHLQRSKNGLRGTDGIIQTMIGYGLRAGLLNCIGSVASTVLLGIMPHEPYYVAIYVIFSRVYANSLLAMLNWRMPQKAICTNNSDPEAIELSSAHLGLSISSFVTHFTIPELENMHP